jgi:hypothetical protein
MDVTGIGLEDVDWVDLAGCCEHGDEHSGSVKFGEFID